MSSLPTGVNDWRSALTSEEMALIVNIQADIDAYKRGAAELQKRKREVQDRARKRFKRGVDKHQVSA